MLFLFQHKRKQSDAANKKASEKADRNIVYNFIIGWQTRWAAWMGRKTAHLSATAKKRALAVFCLLAGGYSLLLMLSGFSKNQLFPFTPTSIQVPAYTLKTGEETTKPPH